MDEKIEKVKIWLGKGSINVFGRPFAGKDTQCRNLADRLDGEMVAGGDILRHYPDQTKLNEIMASGKLIPSDLYSSIVLPYLSKPEFRDKRLILSAVGRRQGEEAVILQSANQSGHPVKAVILLQLDEEEVWQRFEKAKEINDRGERTDDSQEVLITRLEKFQDETMPVLEYYRDRDLLIEVDGSLSRDKVTEEIINKLFEQSLTQY